MTQFSTMATIHIKRIYEPSNEADGLRVLVDRLWPRGVKKETANIDLWLKEVAPSTELRKRFHGAALNWEEFRAKYMLELDKIDAFNNLLAIAKKNNIVTLLYAARDEQQNHALILQQLLKAAAGH